MSTSDAARRSPTDSGARATDRHALIEQLLLAGLDHYFVGEYEQAIHVWTRVFFLDRGHTRAKAYIERARCALAERQREAEARGAEEAFALGSGSGSGFAAASALRAPVAAELPTIPTAPPDAQPRPRRLSRRDLWRGVPEHPPQERSTTPVARSGARLGTHILLIAVAAILLCSAAYVVIARDRLATWWRTPVDLAPAAAAAQTDAEPLPIPRVAERTLDRARSLFARGHLHEALQMLAVIGPDDPLRREADALLIDVERALLESAGLRTTPSSRTAAPVPLSER